MASDQLKGGLITRMWQRLSRFGRDGVAQSSEPSDLPRLTLYQRAHGYAYLRWPYGYIGSAIGEKRSLRWLRPLFAPFLWRALFPMRWAREYHGKVVPTGEARRLVSVREDVSVTVPEQVIPHPTARDIILHHPDRIVALDCPCRLARENPCYPLDVCLIVGEPFAGFVLEYHAKHARLISSGEALEILDQEAARGHVHHAFFKEALGGRFYAICNCCSCCCGAISAQRYGTPMLISSGYVAAHRADLCQRCGACAAACPFGAIDLERATPVDATCCLGCGVCVSRCEAGAMSVQRDPAKPEPLSLQALGIATD